MPTGTRTPEKFAKHFRDVEWTATKDDLVENARSTAAPPEIVQEILGIPGERFGSPEQRMMAYENAWGRR